MATTHTAKKQISLPEDWRYTKGRPTGNYGGNNAARMKLMKKTTGTVIKGAGAMITKTTTRASMAQSIDTMMAAR